MHIKPSTEYNQCQEEMIKRKYGMFIHFGINTFNDKEWSNGKLPVSSYNPTKINAEQWVKNAKEVGMTYVILITKHHDGFCLWDTDTTDYCVNKSQNKTDVVAEVAAACKKYGIKLGLYYSLWDRNVKIYSDHKKYIEYMEKQLEELMTQYGEIVELWLDGGWDKAGENWDIPRLYDLVKKYQPGCAFSVNLTIGKKNIFGVVKKKVQPEKYEKFMQMRYFPCDFRLFDPYFTRADDPKLYNYNGQTYCLPFEATICIRNMKNWFWDTDYTKDKLVDVDFIVEKYKLLIEHQNLLVINIAPNKDGDQEESDIEQLRKVASVLKIGDFSEIGKQ